MLCRNSVIVACCRAPLSTFFSEFPINSAMKVGSNGFRDSFFTCNSFMASTPGMQASPLSLSWRRLSACRLTHAASSSIREATDEVADEISYKRKMKALQESPEYKLKQKLDQCAKKSDLHEALTLYDEARMTNIQLNQHHYNVLLYLCSLAASSGRNSEEETIKNSELGLRRGFEIYHRMMSDNVVPDEATFTNAARLASASDDPEMALSLILQMKACNIPPKLRSYGPALIGFCKKGLVERAFEVDNHMNESGLTPEEPELSALLKLCADKDQPGRVYELLHRLRVNVRQVSEATSTIIVDWFATENASRVGEVNIDDAKIKQGVKKGGGGWHGQGWLGCGKWEVSKTEIDDEGVCRSCRRKLVCIDIDSKETESFASSISKLALEKEKRENFLAFTEWLEHHGPFDAVIDGANVGLYDRKTFNFQRLNQIANRVRNLSPSKRFPLIILHRNRVTGGPARSPDNRRLLETWKNSGSFYASPIGSNDDWYWLYAAVRWQCLLITNDEMRDHIFQLLGTSFFPRWKEKHQVRLSLEREMTLHMPPPYSIVIQESERGEWHIPTLVGDDLNSPRQWLCCSRPSIKL